jgi:hypothetical protein
MTFFRSAVFAIFAIHSLLTGMCRQPKSIARGSTWLLGVSLFDDRCWTTNERRPISNPAGLSRAEAVHCTRLQNLTRIAAATSD